MKSCGRRACDNPASHGAYCYYHRETRAARLRWRFIHSKIGGFIFWGLVFPCFGMLCTKAHPSGRCVPGGCS